MDRRKTRLLAAFTIAALCSTAGSAKDRPAAEAKPAIDADFPDPAVLKAPDGFYYAYATQTEREGKWVNLQVARSRDLKRWQWIGDALPSKPKWASKTQDFWVVGNCVSLSAALELMETGIAGLLVGVGPGAACTSREVLGHRRAPGDRHHGLRARPATRYYARDRPLRADHHRRRHAHRRRRVQGHSPAAPTR